MSNLINGDMLYGLKVYCAKIEDYDSIARADLLICKTIKEWERQERLEEEALGVIFTTGLPQEDVDRYYSS